MKLFFILHHIVQIILLIKLRYDYELLADYIVKDFKILIAIICNSNGRHIIYLQGNL